MSTLNKSLKETTLDSLAEMELFLRKYCVSRWAKDFAHHHKMLRRNFSAENIRDALKIFEGGMGSFNDLAISHSNGHNIKKDEEKTVWQDLKLLRQKVLQNLNECKNAL